MSPTSKHRHRRRWVSRPVQTCPDLCPDLRASNRGRCPDRPDLLAFRAYTSGVPRSFTPETFTQKGVDGVDGVDNPRAATVSAVQTFFTWSGRSGQTGGKEIAGPSGDLLTAGEDGRSFPLVGGETVRLIAAAEVKTGGVLRE